VLAAGSGGAFKRKRPTRHSNLGIASCETGGRIRGILIVVATPTIDELLAVIRQLPLGERRTLIARATQDADQDTPRPPPAGQPASLLGLMADEPEVVDEMCSVVYEARETARMRTLDE
jgi:hypothetical protein